MDFSYRIIPLTSARLTEAVSLVVNAGLDTQEEIEHHLKHIDAHYIALVGTIVVGVIGWYQDNVHYADTAMGKFFPGGEAYWVGFFAVDQKYQNRGIGAALLETLEEAIRKKGTHVLWVSSVPETKWYYERKGFVLTSEGKIGGKQKFFLSKQLT